MRGLLALAAALVLGAWSARAPAVPSAQDVSLRTEDGVTLAGSLHLPARPGPAVVLLHMQTRSRDDWQAVPARLAEAGFVALAIDLRGHGESEPGPPGSGPDDWSRSILDVKAARTFLAGRPDVVQGRLGLAGASIGANLAILYAGGDQTVRSLALLSVGLDYRGLRTEAPLAKPGKRAVLLVASDEETYAANSARRLSQQEGAGTRELRLLTGAGHGTVMLGRQPDLVGALVDWFRRTLL